MTKPRRSSLALFPASFDPLTNGHLDLIRRAGCIFDEIVVAVTTNVGKDCTFSLDERLEMLNDVLGSEPGIRVQGFDGLVVELARETGAQTIIRGLRAMSDFEYEFEMALMNRHLAPDTETFFMMASLDCLYVSSSRLKELARFGVSVDDFVPPIVARFLRRKLGSGGS